jgi:hypothetical protein
MKISFIQKKPVRVVRKWVWGAALRAEGPIPQFGKVMNHLILYEKSNLGQYFLGVFFWYHLKKSGRGDLSEKLNHTPQNPPGLSSSH